MSNYPQYQSTYGQDNYYDQRQADWADISHGTHYEYENQSSDNHASGDQVYATGKDHASLSSDAQSGHNLYSQNTNDNEYPYAQSLNQFHVGGYRGVYNEYRPLEDQISLINPSFNRQDHNPHVQYNLQNDYRPQVVQGSTAMWNIQAPVSFYPQFNPPYCQHTYDYGYQLASSSNQNYMVNNFHGVPNAEYNERLNAAGNFHNAQNVSFGGNAQVVNANRDYISHTTNNINSENNILKELAKAGCLEAGHEIVKDVDRPKCHEDTRKAVITDVMSWIDSDNPNEKIMWLKGPAGAGKSSIAQSICIRCREEGKLMSSFFFSRAAGGDRADGTKLIVTIAYQLTQEAPETKKYLVEELAKNPAILSYTANAMQLQLQKLVLQPLSQAIDEISTKGGQKSSVPHLLVIDGLDECHNIQLQSKIIALFATALAPLRVKVKCFIASRPELEIRNAFGQDEISQLTTQIVLDNKYKPDEDIRTYFISEFSVIKRSHTLSSRLRQILNWPAEENIKELVRRASGQFIYAVTVIKYVKDERHNPIERLLGIINISSGKETKYKELDALYSHILNSAVQNAEGYENILHVFQVIIYRAILYKENFFYNQWASSLTRVHNMASFLNVPEDNISLTVVDLHSLMFIPNDNEGCLGFSHASFIDYLKDENRSGIFFVEKKTAHKFLARYCLVHAVENKSQDVSTDSDNPVYYSRSAYLTHLEDSDFDDELLEELMNQEGLQLLIDQFIMRRYIDDDKLIVLEAFYNWELFDEYDESVARPRLERIRPVCECISNATNDFVVTKLCDEEIEHFLSLDYLTNRIPNIFHHKWRKSIMLNPLKGQQFYLGNKRSQHIWRRVWKLLQDPKSEACSEIDNKDVPSIFEYLLKRIEPCPEFNSFLGRFLETFEEWYFDESESEPRTILDSWVSLQHSISSYIEKCDNLMMSNNLRPIDTSNYPFSIEEMEDTPLNIGVKSPWITTKNESTKITTVTYNPALSGDRGRSIGVNRQLDPIQADNSTLSDEHTEHSHVINCQSQEPNPHALYQPFVEYQTSLDINPCLPQDRYNTQISGKREPFTHGPIDEWDTGNGLRTEDFEKFLPDFDYDSFML